MTSPERKHFFLFGIRKQCIPFGIAVLIASILLLFSCETEKPAVETGAPSVVHKTHYSIIYLINGEGSNLFHDAEGNTLYADEEMLKQAKMVAREGIDTEVFIFHLKPAARHAIRGNYYYYYGDSYSRKTVRFGDNTGIPNALSVFLEFYRKHAARYRSGGEGSQWRNFLFYFGHELPVEETDAGRIRFSVDDLVRVLHELRADFGSNGYGFDLVIVSACNSGTPVLISRIAPFTRYSIASPETLYLSHINTEPFVNVQDIEEKGAYRYVLEIARNAFEKLIHETNTAVTVAVYDSEKILPYIADLKSLCMRARRENTGKTSPENINRNTRRAGDGVKASITGTRGIPEYYDCAENPGFKKDFMEGVTVFYRPPLFGPKKGKTKHSGWECIRYAQPE